jgi:hypothetical protein
MAKKKKSTIAKELASTQVNSLGYQGKVQFQIMHGDKVISTKKYSNNGLPDLFKYICHAIAGTYYTALRPCKVALYYCIEDGQYKKPTDFNWEDAIKNNALIEVSPYVVYDATPAIVPYNNSYATTFRFKIPFNWLYKKTFNVVGLFTENNNPCAYYLCTKENAQGSKDWNAEILDDVTGNYSLIVEWTMVVSNK